MKFNLILGLANQNAPQLVDIEPSVSPDCRIQFQGFDWQPCQFEPTTIAPYTHSFVYNGYAPQMVQLRAA